MKYSACLVTILTLTSTGSLAQSGAVVSRDLPEPLQVARFDERSATCLGMSDDRTFSLDLDSNELFAIDTEKRERSSLTTATVQAWKADVAALTARQARLRDQMLADQNLPAELRALLQTETSLPTLPDFDPTWRSLALPGSQSVPALIRLEQRLSEFRAQVTRVQGPKAAEVAQFRCYVDARQVPFEVRDSADDTTARFQLEPLPALTEKRALSDVPLSSLLSEGIHPGAPERADD